MLAVIFRSTRTVDAHDVYAEWSERMTEAVRTIAGYNGNFSFRDEASRQGVTIAYFENEEAITEWRTFNEHLMAQQLGREQFYEDYSVEVAHIERSYTWRRV